MFSSLYHAPPLLSNGDPQAKRQEILDYFVGCYRRYESLFELIAKEEGYYQKADPLRHPLIFYYAHTAVFYINKLRLAGLVHERIDASFESMFAVGVDEMRWDDLDESRYDWPSLQAVRRYRQAVFERVYRLIETLPLTMPIGWQSEWWAIMMCIEHENIHLETSSVLIRQLPLHLVTPHALWKPCETDATNTPDNALVAIAPSEIVAGKKRDDGYYGWDNEYERHHAHIPAFEASRYLVSNKEYLSFVENKGYDTRRFWSDEGWEWRSYEKAQMPRFWRKESNGYRLRVLAQEVPMPWGWPVEVNYHEAEAFCRFLSFKHDTTYTLPTEDEYFAIRMQSGIGRFGEREGAHLALAKGCASPVNVDRFVYGGIGDIAGNVWQWTRTPIYPYEGFVPHKLYDDFTLPTFDGKHNLIKGGSWISCGNESDALSRYAFRRHFYQHAGFRYVRSSYEEKLASNPYVQDAIVAQYCHFGWGSNRLGVANFPAKCIQTVIDHIPIDRRVKAIDIGCATGRSTFELARFFEQVEGVDFSTRFIAQALLLKEGGTLRYATVQEGDIKNYHEVRLSDLSLDQTALRTSFWQADACNLPAKFGDYDLVFAGNLIDRLYDPLAFLTLIQERIKPGGFLALASPYTWQEESTPKHKWIGGYYQDGEAVTTFARLKEILSPRFCLVLQTDIPFVIQESARKHQYTFSELTLWQKV